MKKIELLAPAGNFQCLVAAVQSGADAVYVSGKAFGARSFADNFNKEELEKAVDYCHLRGVKLYVTVNTLVFGDEFPELSDYLKFLNSIGVDAIIVQDMGVVLLAKAIVPKLPIHASTQMTVHNLDGVKFLEKLGIKRVVLSREISAKNIQKIIENSQTEIEVFAHGALCMSYSGQCLMSSIIGGRSGNRGKCAQPCRLPYSINQGTKKAHYLSLKDLSSIQHIQKLKEIGISSLKIEGRMKGPAYVAAVVGIYRKYIDNCVEPDPGDLDLLDRIFNRGGLTDGYLTGKTGKEMFAFDKPDNPYKKGSNDLEKSVLSNLKDETKKLLLEGDIQIILGQKPKLTVKYGQFTAESTFDDAVQPAQKSAATEESIKGQITKTGGTVFEFEKLNINLDEGAFIPSSTLNFLRRSALELLEKKIIEFFKRENQETLLPQLEETKQKDAGFVCEITKMSQFDVVKEYDFKEIWVPFNLIAENKKLLDNLKERIVIVPPAIQQEDKREDNCRIIEELLKDGYLGVLVYDAGQIDRFKEYRCIGGFRLNIFNHYALSFYKGCGLSEAELSPELTISQINKIKKVISAQTMVYGRLPLMITENCVIRNGAKCPCNHENYIIDRMGMKFPVINDHASCRSIILNCKKTFAGFDLQRLSKAGVYRYRLYFTDESKEECVRVCDSFFKNTGYRPEDFTGGHFSKGVE